MLACTSSRRLASIPDFFLFFFFSLAWFLTHKETKCRVFGFDPFLNAFLHLANEFASNFIETRLTVNSTDVRSPWKWTGLLKRNGLRWKSHFYWSLHTRSESARQIICFFLRNLLKSMQPTTPATNLQGAKQWLLFFSLLCRILRKRKGERLYLWPIKMMLACRILYTYLPLR